MDGIKEMFRKNIKLVIVLFAFIAIVAGVTYSATSYLYQSNVIGYNNSNSELSSTNVKAALDEIYNTCITNGNCPDGYTCYDNINPFDIFEDTAVMDNITSTYVSSSTGINFAVSSSNTNGKGLYIRNGTQNDAYPIYYYRGEIANNNVLFAGFCWKIVRTTNTGGIKIIYNGLSSDSQCVGASSSIIGTSLYNPQTVDVSNRIKYTYESGGNTINSSVKTLIDNWYSTYLMDYTSYFEDTVWCNDLSGNAVTRISNGTPTITCSQTANSYTVSSANGNGKLIYPVGLLTSDELQIAGATAEQANVASNTYLRTSNTSVTMTVHSASNEYIYMLDTFGRFNDAFTYLTPQGVRPVVSIKSGIGFAYGSGTKNDPFYIK